MVRGKLNGKALEFSWAGAGPAENRKMSVKSLHGFNALYISLSNNTVALL